MSALLRRIWIAICNAFHGTPVDYEDPRHPSLRTPPDVLKSLREKSYVQKDWQPISEKRDRRDGGKS